MKPFLVNLKNDTETQRQFSSKYINNLINKLKGEMKNAGKKTKQKILLC